jgi:hypothetical protein
MNRSHIWADIPSFFPLPFLIVLSVPTSPFFLSKAVLSRTDQPPHARTSFHIFVISLLTCLHVARLLPVLYLSYRSVDRGQLLRSAILLWLSKSPILTASFTMGLDVFIVIEVEILCGHPSLPRTLAPSGCSMDHYTDRAINYRRGTIPSPNMKPKRGLKGDGQRIGNNKGRVTDR